MNQRPKFHLRPIRQDEFPFAEALHLNAMRPLLEDLGAWNEPLRRAAIRRSFKTSDSRVIVYDGRDIGWLQIAERDFDYNIAQIQILDEYCGLGIGSVIMADLLAKAGQEGRTVSLSAVRNNRAIGLYRRLGFAVIDPSVSPIIDMVWNPGSTATATAATQG
ncbi:GNAT family N-acetyltransferase [Paracoccus aminophilus]|nr:GNAT family N-acetyltransferase [Paracoccus aminophilus]